MLIVYIFFNYFKFKSIDKYIKLLTFKKKTYFFIKRLKKKFVLIFNESIYFQIKLNFIEIKILIENFHLISQSDEIIIHTLNFYKQKILSILSFNQLTK